MTAAQMRMLRGEPEFLKASRFVREIPREMVRLERETSDTRNFLKSPQVPLDRLMGMGKADQGRAGSGERAPLFERPKQQKTGGFQMREFRVVKADHLDYAEGDQVRHVKFGVGTVQAIKDGGKDYEVTVDFENYGIKRMFASFAKLKKV